MLISDGFIRSGSALALHPDILLWDKALSKYKRQWFDCADKTPLEWYAAIADVAPAVLLAEKSEDISENKNIRQCWVASPYSCQLGRDTVQVMPEGAVFWSGEDAHWLCEILNPLLGEEGMRLHAMGAALLLACEQPMDAAPVSFAAISGQILPNRHPEGVDGGRLARLLAEIQMSLHGKHAEYRGGQADIHGLWFWGASPWPAGAPKQTIPIATRNPFLQSVVDGKDAAMLISEAEHVAELLQLHAPLPNNIVLSGAGRAVLLSKTWFPRFGRRTWPVEACKTEGELLTQLRGFYAA
ncbi:MAG: threonine synthase [Mariprofundaceae bacterium]